MPRQPSRSSLLPTFLSILILTTSTSAQEKSAQSDVPKLPPPIGSFAVGRTSFDWTDLKRAADMAGDRGPHAELMVYLWYPMVKKANDSETKSTLFPGAKAIDASPDFSPNLKNKVFGGSWSQVATGAITSHAIENGQIAEQPRNFPVVIFSPGAFGTCFQYSSVIEDLVSHGYVVAAIEHTSEVFGVLFQDGKVHMYSAKLIPKQAIPPPGSSREEYESKLEEWFRHNVDVRVGDISFVLDKLFELNEATKSASQFSGRLDVNHVGVVGHSRGGWAAIVACRRDDRLKACVNEDGNAGGHGLTYPGAYAPKQPILYVEISPVLKPGTTQDDWIVLKQLGLTAEQWIQRWHETVDTEFRNFPSGGYFVQITAPGMEHYSFSDEVILKTQKDGAKDNEEIALHNLRLTEDITRSFLDEVLRNERASSLRGTSEATVKHFDPRN